MSGWTGGPCGGSSWRGVGPGGIWVPELILHLPPHAAGRTAADGHLGKWRLRRGNYAPRPGLRVPEVLQRVFTGHAGAVIWERSGTGYPGAKAGKDPVKQELVWWELACP